MLLCAASVDAEFDVTPLVGLLFAVRDFILKLLGIDTDAPFGTCDGCFCIPEPGEDCPVDEQPDIDFTDLIPVYRQLTLLNAYTLDCNPYSEDPCDTEPPLDVAGGACVVELSGTECVSYSTATYTGTFEEAVTNPDVYVAHAGPCGACSSLQDISIYMELGADLSDESSVCGFVGRGKQEAGVECFKELGFTESCATLWYYNTENTYDECIWLCAPFVILGLSPNGPPPACELNACVECDEEKSGPLFQKFAGGTRRSAGLLSNIVRPCSELVKLERTNPCAI